MSSAGWSAISATATPVRWRSIHHDPRSEGWTSKAASTPTGVAGRIALALTSCSVAAAMAMVSMVALDRIDDLAVIALPIGMAGLTVASQRLLRRDTADLLAMSRRQWFATALRGLATLDRSMHIQETNTRMAELFGVPEGDLLETHLVHYFREADRDAIARRFENMLTTLGAIESDNVVERPDGTRAWVHWRASAITDARGAFDYFLITFEDTSGKHRAEEAASANLAELEKLNHLKSEFASMVSHEFRTALTGIQSMSELMMSGALPAEESREYAGHIFRESERVNRLISDMLDLDRLEAAKLKLRIEPVDLNATIVDAVEALRGPHPRHALVTDLDLMAGAVKGDADRLRQVIGNLLSNAIKFSPDGGEVVVATRVRGGFVEVSVTDHGVGIPADFVDRLFGRFERYENTPSKVIGTGLGLAIARQIVEMHGGRIWAESKEGAGAVFKFTAPLCAPGASGSFRRAVTAA